MGDMGATEKCGTVRVEGDRNKYDLECESWIIGITLVLN